MSYENDTSISVSSKEICLLSSLEDENFFEGCYNKEPEYTEEEFK